MSHASDFAEFKRHCLQWQRRFGLMDWRLNFKSEKQEDGRMAGINVNTDARVAELILRYGKEKERDSSIARLALHEMLHLLLNDLVATVAGCDMHKDSIREEHKVLERLIGVLL